MVTLDGKPLAWGMITLVPEDSDLKPAAFSMISLGKFSIPKRRGAVVGNCEVQIRDMGGFERKPTLENVILFEGSKLNCAITEGENVLEFNLETSRQ